MFYDKYRVTFMANKIIQFKKKLQPKRMNGRKRINWNRRMVYTLKQKPHLLSKLSVMDETHMFVLAVAVSHSPAIETISSPCEIWLKNRG